MTCTTELVDAVAGETSRTHFQVWGFGESIAIEALLASSNPSRMRAVTLLEGWAERPRFAADPAAHVAPGVPLLQLAADGDERGTLRRRADELAEVLRATRRGRYGARIHRPDLAGWEHQVWVDCMHLDGPFLAAHASFTRDMTWADAAADAVLGHARVLQDEMSGLMSHGFDDLTGTRNGVHWGRGQGWALLGLADTAAHLPQDHPARREIVDRLTSLLDALARTDDGSGRWHTVVDNDDTQLETSVSAFVALGAARAARHQLVDARFRPMATRALATTVACISQGRLMGVSDATPVGTTARDYDVRPTSVSAWGQGPALLALLEEAWQ